MKRLAILTLIFLITVGSLFLGNFILFLTTPYGNGVRMRIEPGEGFDSITLRLSDAEVLSNQTLFKVYVRLKRAGTRIRAGEYDFPPGVTPRGLLSLLMSGDFAKLRITIPEGWTVREIAAHLGQQGLLDPEGFIRQTADPVLIQSLGLSVRTLEGYLFPDTYEIYRPKGAEEVIRKMVSRFREIYDETLQKRAVEVGLPDQEVVILASIVEREAGVSEERPIIASVFLNRLRNKMPLASDPTIIYGIPDFSGNLTRADLERPGPYNSYLNPGLPPTPIGNPGLASIRAVLWPAETDYLYFVSRNDGTHQFSKTLEEQGAAVYKYQVLQRVGETQSRSPITETSPR